MAYLRRIKKHRRRNNHAFNSPCRRALPGSLLKYTTGYSLTQTGATPAGELKMNDDSFLIEQLPNQTFFSH
jgi:hypothetical protein